MENHVTIATILRSVGGESRGMALRKVDLQPDFDWNGNARSASDFHWQRR
jgi:hypothetical protein